MFSLADRDKTAGLVAARRFAELGFALVATAGTAQASRPRGPSTRSSASSPGRCRAHRRRPRRRGRAAGVGQGTTWWSTRPAGAGRGPTARYIRRTATARVSPAPPRWRRRSRRPRGGRLRHPGRPRRSRSRSTTATASSASRCDGSGAGRPVAALGPLTLASPVVTAGTYGHGAEVARFGDATVLGAVTAKSPLPEPAGQPGAAAAHDRRGW